MCGGLLGVGRPVLACQSIACSGGSPVIPSHQMSPSSVIAQLVKIVLRSIVAIALGLVLWLVLGATPKKPASGLTAEAAVGAELHPGDVVADRLDLPVGQGRDQHRQVGLAAGPREGAGHVLDRALRRGQLEDQHVLGEPALVARHRRGDPQREALLAEQRVAAVAGAVGPDLPRLGVVDDVLVVRVARPGDVLGALGERHPDRVHAGHELAVGAQRLEGGPPIRVMIRIEAAT